MAKIKIKRGLAENLPTLEVGELALTTDSEKVLVGTNSGNKEIGLEDSGWLEPTLLNSVTSSDFRYKKLGNTVILTGKITSPNATGNQLCFILPEGFRPTTNVWVACPVNGAAVNTTNAQISKDSGNFVVYISSGASAMVNARFETE